MVKRIKPIGNSFGLIIDRPILDLLKIGRDTDLEVTVTADGTGLNIRPVEAGDHRSRVRQSAKRMAAVHRDSLQRLAE